LWTPTLAELDPRWFLVVVMASLTYGVMSPVVKARRFLFLAGALPHSALLSALLAIVLERTLNFPFELGSILLSLLLVSIVSLLISKGISPDSATAIFVSFTVSMTTIVLYYILTAFPMETSVWALIIGDPLLVSWSDVRFGFIITVAVVLSLLPFLREQILLGVDRDFVRLSGIRPEFYDAMLVVAMALSTVGLLKVVGFVVEHVMILLPGVTAAMFAKSGRQAVVASILISVLGGLAGLALSLATGLAPSGVIGLVLLAIYLVVSRR